MKTPLPVFLPLLLAGLSAFAADNAPRQAPLANATAAINRAIQLTDLNLFSKKISAVERVAAQNDNPFVWLQLSERRVWSVKFGPALLKLKSASASMHDQYAKTFEVVLDKKTGWLISVRSSTGDAPADDPPIKTSWLVISPEEQAMRNIGEHINGLAGYDPKLTFLDALNRTGSYAYSAKRIDAYCVNYTDNQSLTPRPCVWYFTFRNIMMTDFPSPPQVPNISAAQQTAANGYTPVTPITPIAAPPAPAGPVPSDHHSVIDGMIGGDMGNDDIEITPAPKNSAPQ